MFWYQFLFRAIDRYLEQFMAALFAATQHVMRILSEERGPLMQLSIGWAIPVGSLKKGCNLPKPWVRLRMQHIDRIRPAAFGDGTGKLPRNRQDNSNWNPPPRKVIVQVGHRQASVGKWVFWLPPMFSLFTRPPGCDCESASFSCLVKRPLLPEHTRRGTRYAREKQFRMALIEK